MTEKWGGGDMRPNANQSPFPGPLSGCFWHLPLGEDKNGGRSCLWPRPHHYADPPLRGFWQMSSKCRYLLTAVEDAKLRKEE